MPAVTSRNILTRTELETLAVMLHSAHRHMSYAKLNGEHVWEYAVLNETVEENLQGFYALQTDPWAELVHL